jgi:hypothetical protein
MKKIDEMGLGKRLEKFHYHLKYQYTLWGIIRKIIKIQTYIRVNKINK